MSAHHSGHDAHGYGDEAGREQQREDVRDGLQGAVAAAAADTEGLGGAPEAVPDVQAQGKSAMEAALAAARLRFRPIIMTSMAFTLGVVPLFIASGAGSASQRAIGTGVIGGMLASTLVAVFFVPLFFWILEKKKS